MPLVRPCRNRHCPEYGGPSGWCSKHERLPFYGQPPMPPGWGTIRAAALKRAGYRCQDCGQRASEVHHVISRAAGGDDSEANLRALCSTCHGRITGQAGGAAWP